MYNLVQPSRTTYDAVQRAAMWKQRCQKEERVCKEAEERDRKNAASKVPSLPVHEVVPWSARSHASLRRKRRSARSTGSVATSRSRTSMSDKEIDDDGSSSLYSRRTPTARSTSSSSSNLTQLALSRITRLEQTLNEERYKRMQAETELEQLRQLVESRLPRKGT